MRFHVCSLPHTQTTEFYSACAYTNKVRGFCRMMKERGHTVFLYAGEKNDAPCDELITCVSEAERKVHVGDGHYSAASWDYSLPFWQRFNAHAATCIGERKQHHDIICIIGGLAHKQIADALPDMITVEFGIGYGGNFAPYRVWESYAWMHSNYAVQKGDVHAVDGFWFDAVIPGYLDPAEFPFLGVKDDYYLFIGRLTKRKGAHIAMDVCQKLGKNLVVAGPMADAPVTYGEYVGVVGPQERGSLMSKAQAVFVPTEYIEPFGNVAIEAMACGTPVITTDWGAFTETVIDGVTGFRCRTQAEFCDATEKVKTLDCAAIRQHVVDRYALDVIGAKYETYFKRVLTLYGGKGWYEEAA